MEINRIKKLIGLATLLSTALTTTAFAQNAAIQSKKLPLSLLRKMNPHAAHSNASFAKVGQAKKSLISTAATSGIPGIDSVVNWSDQFTAPGFDSNGNAQSVWPYTMVGNPPESGRTANITAPIVPVVLDLLAKDGTVAIFNGKPLSFGPGPDVLKPQSPRPSSSPLSTLRGSDRSTTRSCAPNSGTDYPTVMALRTLRTAGTPIWSRKSERLAASKSHLGTGSSLPMPTTTRSWLPSMPTHSATSCFPPPRPSTTPLPSERPNWQATSLHATSRASSSTMSSF